MVEPTTLYLVRHGEIDRPPVAEFDEAVLTDHGRDQIHALALRWPLPIPDLIYCSPLARSIETASVFASVFRRPIRTVHGLEEWGATQRNVPQDVYRDLERRSWADFEFVNDEGESLSHATNRIIYHLRDIAGRHADRAVMVSGHAILFALFIAHVRGERATEEAKNRIGFANWGVMEHRRGWRVVRDFAP